MNVIQNFLDSRWPFLSLRVSGHYLLALLCFVIPEAGENRLIGGLLLTFVIGPAVLLVSYRLGDGSGSYQLHDLLCDLAAVVAFGFLLPEHWNIIFMIGIVVSLAPSVSIQRNSSRTYGVALVILIAGMSASGIYNDIDRWYLAVFAISVLVPTVVFYAFWQMRRADQLRDSAAAHESLMLISGGVAHDFNNILTGISGNAELALRTLDASSPAYSSVKQVLAATEAASRLTRQLLSFSGRGVAEKETIDLFKELEVTASLARSLADDDVRIVVNRCEGSSLVEADPALLQQVFLNLLVNAIEATTGPSIISVDLRSADGMVWVDVTDEGHGIARDEISRIFDPFYTSKSRGHGLGLATAKRIVEQHGGNIAVQSDRETGTTFTISLPVSQDTSIYNQGAQAAAQRAESRRVLVIDDDDAVRGLLRNALEPSGLEVIEAADGENGIQRFNAFDGEFRFVLLDLKMPGISGWECLSQIRALARDLPVVIISGYDPSDEAHTVDKDPSTAFVAKPFRLGDLEKSINKLLENPIQFAG